jgi:hypothetical protein
LTLCRLGNLYIPCCTTHDRIHTVTIACIVTGTTY